MHHTSINPAQLHKRTIRSGTIGLSIIALILALGAIFFALGISRSAQSNYIFELVIRQLAQAERLAALASDVHYSTDATSRTFASNDLSKAMLTSENIQQQIKQPLRWGPMDAQEVDVFRQAYTQAPLAVDKHFTEMIKATESFIEYTDNDLQIQNHLYKQVRVTTEIFQTVQSQVVDVYLRRIDTVLDQSRVRIVSIFIALFTSLLLCYRFLLKPFAQYIRSQAEEVEQTNLSLKAVAMKDFLTGLPNRAFISKSLQQEMKLASEREESLALLNIDLDHFKEINDTYGHAAGDCVLVTIAQRMQATLSTNEVVARIGGDEFLMILPNQGRTQAFTTKLDFLIEEICKPIDFDGITLKTTASIGITCYPKDSKTVDELIVNSDLALYEMKKENRDNYCFFEQEMREQLVFQRNIEQELRTALNNNELRAFLQPQVDVLHKKMLGVECLVRWEHPSRGFISPAVFLPVATNSGLMVRLGRQVMKKAIAEVANWHKTDVDFGRLSLNVSAQELLEDDFVEWILGTAIKNNLPTDKLSIELLETIMMDDRKLNLPHKIDLLRNANVNIELDDFGTGYASLKQIKPEMIDRLKIDRAFICDIDLNTKNEMIVRAMVSLANSLKIEIIAEGAENQTEIATLMRIGCNAIQGYGIAKPMPANQTLNWINHYNLTSLYKPDAKLQLVSSKL